jgi:hypothetical protein
MNSFAIYSSVRPLFISLTFWTCEETHGSQNKQREDTEFHNFHFVLNLAYFLPEVCMTTPKGTTESATGCDGDGSGKREPDKTIPTGHINLNRAAQLFCASPHFYSVISRAQIHLYTQCIFR